MTSGAQLSPDGRTVTIRVPLAFRKRSGRKRVVAPNGTDPPLLGPPGQVSTLVKALARAHRWQRMLESGEYASIAELAAAEKINSSYLARVLRLTLLAPEVIESTIATDDGTQALDRWLRHPTLLWRQQAQEASDRPASQHERLLTHSIE